MRFDPSHTIPLFFIAFFFIACCVLVYKVRHEYRKETVTVTDIKKSHKTFRLTVYTPKGETLYVNALFCVGLGSDCSIYRNDSGKAFTKGYVYILWLVMTELGIALIWEFVTMLYGW